MIASKSNGVFKDKICQFDVLWVLPYIGLVTPANGSSVFWGSIVHDSPILTKLHADIFLRFYTGNEYLMKTVTTAGSNFVVRYQEKSIVALWAAYYSALHNAAMIYFTEISTLMIGKLQIIIVYVHLNVRTYKGIIADYIYLHSW